MYTAIQLVSWVIWRRNVARSKQCKLDRYRGASTVRSFVTLPKSVYAVVLHAVVAATLAAAVSAWWCERLAALIAPFSFQCIYQGRVP